MFRALCVTSLLVCCVFSKTIDNKLIGTPTVTCGPNYISIAAESEEEFEGQVFVKGFHKVSDCRSVYSESNTTRPEMRVPLDRLASCGLDITRNAKSRDLEILSVFVFSFHPSFVTAGDRAFAVHCIFHQKDYQVATNFDLGELVASTTLSGAVSLPSVSLDVVSGRPTNDSLAVGVGHPLLLAWHMNMPSELYGVRVLACHAESADGRRMQLIDRGCSRDRALVSNVRYSDDQQRAFADVTAFKFADASAVYFRCAVQLCIKRFEHLIVPPTTSTSGLCEAAPDCSSDMHRERRSVSSLSSRRNVIVVSGQLSPDSLASGRGPRSAAQVLPATPSTLCLSPAAFAASVAGSGFIYLLTLIVLSVTRWSSKRE